MAIAIRAGRVLTAIRRPRAVAPDHPECPQRRHWSGTAPDGHRGTVCRGGDGAVPSPCGPAERSSSWDLVSTVKSCGGHRLGSPDRIGPPTAIRDFALHPLVGSLEDAPPCPRPRADAAAHTCRTTTRCRLDVVIRREPAGAGVAKRG